MNRVKDFLKRITGISTPVGGVSWTPSPDERKIANNLLIYLEDRRVLYNPCQLEIPSHCAKSVIDIRGNLTEFICDLPADSELVVNLKAMRASARKFLDAYQELDGMGWIQDSMSPRYYSNWLDELGQMRAIFGIHIASIASKYNIEIEDTLMSILPADPDSDDGDRNDYRR